VLGVEHTVIESVELESDGRGGEVLVARVRPKAGVARRCSRCQRRAPVYDTSAKPRRWRGLDLGATRVFLGGHDPAGVVSRAWGGGWRGAVGTAWVVEAKRSPASQ
jgi:transposase